MKSPVNGVVVQDFWLAWLNWTIRVNGRTVSNYLDYTGFRLFRRSNGEGDKANEVEKSLKIG